MRHSFVFSTKTVPAPMILRICYAFFTGRLRISTDKTRRKYGAHSDNIRRICGENPNDCRTWIGGEYKMSWRELCVQRFQRAVWRNTLTRNCVFCRFHNANIASFLKPTKFQTDFYCDVNFLFFTAEIFGRSIWTCRRNDVYLQW